MFSPQVIADAKKHALECFPEESCGLVVNGVYVPERNISPDPTKKFAIDPGRYPLSGLEALIHSHPGQGTSQNPLCPSAADMNAQMAMAKPWGIIPVVGDWAGDPLWFGDQVPIAPLIGRPFVSGVHDCYAGVRDLYRLDYGITLKNYARDYLWWYKKGENLLEDNFADAGFIEVPTSQIQPGDVILMALRSDHPTSHCGVYLAGGLIFHHLIGRLSRREPIHGWMRFVRRVVRYADGLPSRNTG